MNNDTRPTGETYIHTHTYMHVCTYESVQKRAIHIIFNFTRGM